MAGWRSYIAEIQPVDWLAGLGPALLAVVCAFVLYGLQVPINFLVVVGIGLVYWPAYELMGLLVERGLVTLFVASTPEVWRRFRNGFYPLLLIAVIVGLFAFGQWFWMIVFGQVLGLVFSPPSEQRVRQGCLHAAVTAILLFLVIVAAIFSVPESLSGLFNFPNVSGPFRYLPGMLIIGTVYYLLMSALLIVMQPALRKR